MLLCSFLISFEFHSFLQNILGYRDSHLMYWQSSSSWLPLVPLKPHLWYFWRHFESTFWLLYLFMGCSKSLDGLKSLMSIGILAQNVKPNWHPSPECRLGFTLEWIPYSSKCNACSKPYVARQVSWHLEFSAGFHLVKMSKCHELTSMGIPKPMQQIFLALEHTYYRHPGDRLKAFSLLSGVSLMLAYWSYREYMVTSTSFVFISGHCFQGSF